MTNLKQLKDILADIIVEFGELPAELQKKYIDKMLFLYERMMDEHDLRLEEGAIAAVEEEMERGRPQRH